MITNVALQAKLKSARHNGAQAPLKVVLLSDLQYFVVFSQHHAWFIAPVNP